MGEGDIARSSSMTVTTDARSSSESQMTGKQKRLANLMRRPGGQRSGEVWDVFQQCDTDGSGTIDTEEVAALCKKLGVRLTEEELEDAIDKMDKDGNGTVEYDEFCEHPPPVSPFPPVSCCPCCTPPPLG